MIFEPKEPLLECANEFGDSRAEHDARVVHRKVGLRSGDRATV